VERWATGVKIRSSDGLLLSGLRQGFERYLVTEPLQLPDQPLRARLAGSLPVEIILAELLLEGVMNFSSETVAFWHGDSKTIPKRRFRRRVGLCRSISGPRSRRRPSAQPRVARGFQCSEMGCAHWLCVALYATRPAPWEAVYQQTQRWLRAGVFETIVHDLRVLLLRLSKGKASEPTAAILDSRTLRSTPESCSRGGYDGAKSKKASKVHAAVDTLGHLLACLSLRPTNRRELG